MYFPLQEENVRGRFELKIELSAITVMEKIVLKSSVADASIDATYYNFSLIRFDFLLQLPFDNLSYYISSRSVQILS